MVRHLRLILSLVLLLFLFTDSCYAQTGTMATVSQLDDSGFPTIRFFLDIHDDTGGFFHNITADQVTILEDGQSLPAINIHETKPGLQLVVAINPGPSLAIRNSQAVSRFDLISRHLAEWAKSRIGSDIDDLSLVINNGPVISHVKDPRQWLQTLETAQVDFRDAVPNLDGLSRAITIANDATPRAGMERAILLITPAIEAQQIEPLDNLLAQIQQQNISVHIWFVASTGGFQTASVKKLTELANQTNGSFFAFSGDETLPDPESIFEELRFIYSIDYKSSISTGGAHQISAQIQTGDQTIVSNPLEINIDLQPTLPAFISPPIRIIRQPEKAGETTSPKSNDQTLWEPANQDVEVVFDFPDGRKRDIISSALLVNGEVVAENSQPPFEFFNWDISQISSGGTFVLQVQATDEFNITGKSVEIPVIIGVEQIAQDPWGVIRKNTPMLITIAVFISGAILLLVLILGGQLRPRPVRLSQRRRKRQDPLTQPVSIESDLSRHNMPAWADRFQRIQPGQTKKALAYLYPLFEDTQFLDSVPLVLNSEEVLIGSSPDYANLVLKDGSIEKIHAKLVRKADGSFRINDEGSIAGTWINYSPVSQFGANLEHGDLVHIGRLGFRFTIRQPKLVRRPVVTTLPPQAPTHPNTKVKNNPSIPKANDSEIAEGSENNDPS